MTTRDYDGFLGLELTSEKWLRNHFLAKIQRRIQQMSRLPIEAGERVLDVCCGPGYYTEFFSQMVGPTGFVYAVDKDPALIDSAESRQPYSANGKRIKYFCADINKEKLSSVIAGEQFDVIVFFNCLSFFNDPIKIVTLYKTLLRPGGRIVLKDSDFGHILITPFDDQLLHRVIEAAQASPPRSFNNFFGRVLPSIASQLRYSQSKIEIWSYPIHAPLSEAEKTYVSINLMTLLHQGSHLLNTEDAIRWADSFSIKNTGALIHQADFFFLMHEIVTISSADHSS